MVQKMCFAGFRYELKARFEPVVDTQDQSVAPLEGLEVEVNAYGERLSGGAPFKLSNLILGDSDGSETAVDITRIDLPEGFQSWIDGSLIPGLTGSLANRLGGVEALKQALAAGKVQILPVDSTGNIDSDYPSPLSRTTDFTFNIKIADQQNSLSVTRTITASGHIDWWGEVDGQQPPASPLDPGENTQVWIKNPSPVVHNDFPLQPLQLAATDIDNSEHLKTDKRPQYEIAVYDHSGQNKVTGDWHLETNAGQVLIFDGNDWLVQSGSLEGVTVHFTHSGSYQIETRTIVNDVGDEEARFARMKVTVPDDSGTDTPPIRPESVFTCDFLEGKEDAWIPVDRKAAGKSCIDLTQSHTSDVEETTFRITVADLHGWSLQGASSVYWNNNGYTTEYVIKPEHFSRLSFRPPRDFSGQDSVTYHILKRNTESDETSNNGFQLTFKVRPVVENSEDEPAYESEFDLRTWTDPAAKADEWKEHDVSAPVNLHIQTTDVDTAQDRGVETLEHLRLTPPPGITLSGNGLIPDGAGYITHRQRGESEADFETRIRAFTFTPGEGLNSGTYPLKLDATVHDTTTGLPVTGPPGNSHENPHEKTFNKEVSLIVNPVNHCTALTSTFQTGKEDSDIEMKGLMATLNDNDGSEVLSVVLSGVPNGAVVKAASGQPLPFNGAGKWQIPENRIDPAGSIQTLLFHPARDFSGTVKLTLNAYSHEQALGEVCTNRQAFEVKVQPQGDEVTLDQLETTYSGDENSDIPLAVNIQTTDRFSDAQDHTEGIQVTLTLKPDSGSLLYPPEPEAIKPSLVVPGAPLTPLIPGTSGELSVTVTTESSSVSSIWFNSGDGHGSTEANIRIRSVDRTEDCTTSLGPEVVLSSHFTIQPKSDKPSLHIDRRTVFMTVDTAAPLQIQMSVINPATTVSNLAGTELYALVQGMPGSGLLQNSASSPVGTPSTNPPGTVLTAREVGDLFLKDSHSGHYTLEVRSISDAGDGAPRESAPETVRVFVINKAADITGTEDDDILVAGMVANGQSQLVSASGGNDLVVAGPGQNRIQPGSGNNEVWGGAYQGAGDGQSDVFAFLRGDHGQTLIRDFEPGLDQLDLSDLLSLNAVWSSTELSSNPSTNVVIQEVSGSTQITVQQGAGSETITLDQVPLDTLISGGAAMDGAARLSALVSSSTLVASRQFGHEGSDHLQAPPSSELVGDKTVHGGPGDDRLFAHEDGSRLQGGPGNDLLELNSASAPDRLILAREDAGTSDHPSTDTIKGFQPDRDTIDIAAFLPMEAAPDPLPYLDLVKSSTGSILQLASETQGEWTSRMEFDIDQLQGHSSEEAITLMIEQNALYTGFNMI